MKRLLSTMLFGFTSLCIFAQKDTTRIKTDHNQVITVIENDKSTQVKVGNDKGIEVVTNNSGDTTHIRIGRRTFNVVEGGNSTYVKVDKEERRKETNSNFNPHWAGLEFGMNMFHQTDYSVYHNLQTEVPNDFMELHYGKSISVNLNIMEWAFSNEANNFALVTGLGFSFMDYTFDQPLTVEKREGDGLLCLLV